MGRVYAPKGAAEPPYHYHAGILVGSAWLRLEYAALEREADEEVAAEEEQSD